MLPRAPSINTLARTLGLSRTTVSDALRGKGRVSPDTVTRVRAAADAAGYRANPLVSTVLGAIHHARKSTCRGALAVVDIQEDGIEHGPFPRELIAGAKARAAEMGFTVGEFAVGRQGISWARLDTILQSRGTHGIIVLPTWFDADLASFDWSRYASILTDYVSTGPELHSVCSDHYASMCALLTRLVARGYKRPGLVLQQRRDERIRHRQSAAFTAFASGRTGLDFIPPLLTPGRPQFATEFAPWFCHHQPDVVLSHFAETPDFIRACATGEPPGFVLLNILHQTKPCAALDLQPRLLGARAVEMVVGQILRNEIGVPAWPSRTTVEAKFVEGPTIRPAPARVRG